MRIIFQRTLGLFIIMALLSACSKKEPPRPLGTDADPARLPALGGAAALRGGGEAASLDPVQVFAWPSA